MKFLINHWHETVVVQNLWNDLKNYRNFKNGIHLILTLLSPHVAVSRLKMWPLGSACQGSNPGLFHLSKVIWGKVHTLSLGFIFTIDKRKVIIISTLQEALKITHINIYQGTWIAGYPQQILVFMTTMTIIIVTTKTGVSERGHDWHVITRVLLGTRDCVSQVNILSNPQDPWVTRHAHNRARLRSILQEILELPSDIWRGIWGK